MRVSTSYCDNTLVIKFNAMSVPFTKISEIIDIDENEALLKSLGETLASLLPNLKSLCWSNISSPIGSFYDNFDLEFSHCDSNNENRVIKLELSGKTHEPHNILPTFSSINKEARIKQPYSCEGLMGPEISSDLDFLGYYRFFKNPNSMGQLSLLTKLSTQRSDIRTPTTACILGLSSLKSLPTCCVRRVRSQMELTFSVETSGFEICHDFSSSQQLNENPSIYAHFSYYEWPRIISLEVIR